MMMRMEMRMMKVNTNNTDTMTVKQLNRTCWRPKNPPSLSASSLSSSSPRCPRSRWRAMSSGLCRADARQTVLKASLADLTTLIFPTVDIIIIIIIIVATMVLLKKTTITPTMTFLIEEYHEVDNYNDVNKYENN